MPVPFMTAGSRLLLVLFCLTASVPALAQDGAGSIDTSSPAARFQDPFGRETPAGFVRGLIKALAAGDTDRAVNYLDLGAFPPSARKEMGIRRVQQLSRLLDEGGWLTAVGQISTEPQGTLDDGLEPELDRFASVRTPGGTVDLLIKRTKAENGDAIWRVSRETIDRIPVLLDQVETGILEDLLPVSLEAGPRILGVPLIQWAIVVAFAATAYGVARLAMALAVFLARPVLRGDGRGRREHYVKAALPPLRICLAVWIFSAGRVNLGVALVAREYLGFVAILIGWAALGWLIWRIIDAIAAASIDHISQGRQWGALSAVRFFRRAAKVLLVAAVMIIILDALGLDVTTGLAALGIGGLAVALGAQKTIENLVGGVMLIADQPVREGDFCRFGDTLGTVEDIGMRSTRLRTLNRTVVSIPNGDFSSMQIENYGLRDMFFFRPTLSLRYETTPDQIRYLLVELRALLYGHPRVDPDPARVRFVGLGADSLSIEIFAYVRGLDFSEFLEVQEDLLLRIMDIVAEAGAAFAFPSQTVYLSQDPSPNDEGRRRAEEKVATMRDQDDLPLPRFDPDRLAALKDTIPYPPPGSVDRAKRGMSTSDAVAPSEAGKEASADTPTPGWHGTWWVLERLGIVRPR